jgi:hypothetical protein
MTTDTDEVEQALSAARKAWGDWEGAWAMLLHRMRAAGLSTTRIDAYWVGTGYDEGGNQSLLGWLNEIQDQIEETPEGPRR